MQLLAKIPKPNLKFHLQSHTANPIQPPQHRIVINPTNPNPTTKTSTDIKLELNKKTKRSIKNIINNIDVFKKVNRIFNSNSFQIEWQRYKK